MVLLRFSKNHCPPPNINPNVFEVLIELCSTLPLRGAPASASEPSRARVRCKRDPYRFPPARSLRGIPGAGASGGSWAAPAGQEYPVALQEGGPMWQLIVERESRRQERKPHLPHTNSIAFPEGKEKTMRVRCPPLPPPAVEKAGVGSGLRGWF